eukprot:TRINITY_DN103957_c0_g1_i1.p1 TRINITY_DN103957_c0_g1~~TRINITY_DN103957_c0_g1_i1.p1  ORF type:complete len:1081 (-),score=193.85 TRINITY_DN103957_c0_g1_i1:189-3431(-)
MATLQQLMGTLPASRQVARLCSCWYLGYLPQPQLRTSSSAAGSHHRQQGTGRQHTEAAGSPPPLLFDLPRRLTRHEQQEVKDELMSALARMPGAGQLLPRKNYEDLSPQEAKLREKIGLFCTKVSMRASPEELAQLLRLLVKALTNFRHIEAEGEGLSGNLRRSLLQGSEASLPFVLRRAFEIREILAPEAIANAARLALSLLGPGASEPKALAEALLESLAPRLACLHGSELSSLLSAANAVGSLPGASKVLSTLLADLAERAPAELVEKEVCMALTVLGGHMGEVDSVALEDFMEGLWDYWPLCSSRTLLTALLVLGQAGILDAATFGALVMQLEARSQFLGRSDREALLLLMALHKNAFDRAALMGASHPFYEEASQKLVKELSRDAAARIRALPLTNLARPVLALAQLRAMDKRAMQCLDERLMSGRLLSLPPTAFVSLVYAHRFVRGPVPKEDLRRPLCLAFGALQHAMEPKQIASCIESLKAYCYKVYRHVFAVAYERLALALEAQAEGAAPPWAAISPAEAAAAIRSYPALRFESAGLLLRLLRAVTTAAPFAPTLSAGEKGVAPGYLRDVDRSMLDRMTMVELVDLLEAFGQQGLGCCDVLAKAAVTRYRANGGRISRRNTARALHALAQLGERQAELLAILLEEVADWQIQDPMAVDLRPRPALTALWSICALGLLPSSQASLDYLLEFLCRDSVAGLILGSKKQSLLFFESLGAMRSAVPALARRHLAVLQASHSPAAEKVFFDMNSPLRGPELLSSSNADSPHVALPIPKAVGKDTSPIEHLLLGASSSSCSELGSLVSKALVSSEDFLAEPQAMPGRSLLDEFSMRWEMERRSRAHDGISKPQQVLGEVLAALNLAPVLRAMPHPEGDLAAAATRATGGFELSWPAGSYEVDWGQPHLRLGILVLPPHAFVLQGDGNMLGTAAAGSTRLLAPARLRIRHLHETEGWHLILLQALAIERWLLPWRQDPCLFNQQLRARVARANAMEPIDAKPLLRRLRRPGSTEAGEKVKFRLASQLQRQLEIVFPGALVSAAVAANSASETGALALWHQTSWQEKQERRQIDARSNVR